MINEIEIHLTQLQIKEWTRSFLICNICFKYQLWILRFHCDTNEAILVFFICIGFNQESNYFIFLSKSISIFASASNWISLFVYHCWCKADLMIFIIPMYFHISWYFSWIDSMAFQFLHNNQKILGEAWNYSPNFKNSVRITLTNSLRYRKEFRNIRRILSEFVFESFQQTAECKLVNGAVLKNIKSEGC